jgi:elongation factor G
MKVMTLNTPENSLLKLAIELKSLADKDILGDALKQLTAEDKALHCKTDVDSGMSILSGMDELQLETVTDRLERDFKVECNIGALQVAYHEALGKSGMVVHTHRSQKGVSGQFTRVYIEFTLGEPNTGFVFESKIVGERVPTEFIPAVKKGLQSVMENGLIAGYRLANVHATLIDGAYHDLDSSALAFEIAARAAFREAKHCCEPYLLEPIMTVEVVTPDELTRKIVAGLAARRGTITGQARRDKNMIVTANAPLARLIGYHHHLALLTEGRAQFEMSFNGCEAVSNPSDGPEPPSPAISMRA